MIYLQRCGQVGEWLHACRGWINCNFAPRTHTPNPQTNYKFIFLSIHTRQVTLLSCCMHYLRPRRPGLLGWLLAFYGSSSTGIPMLPCSRIPREKSLLAANHQDARTYTFLYGFLAESFVGKRETVNQCRDYRLYLERAPDQLGSVSERWCGFHPFLM